MAGLKWAVRAVVAVLLVWATLAAAESQEDSVGQLQQLPPTRKATLREGDPHFTLTKKQVQTVTLTYPPSTVTETSTVTSNLLSPTTITTTSTKTNTEQVTEISPTTVTEIYTQTSTKLVTEVSTKLDTEVVTKLLPTTITETPSTATVTETVDLHFAARLNLCLSQMGSVLTECIASCNTVRHVPVTTTITKPITVWLPMTAPAVTLTTPVTTTATVVLNESSMTTIDQSTATVTEMDTATDLPHPMQASVLMEVGELVSSLSALAGQINVMYPLVNDGERRVLEDLKQVVQGGRLSEQLRKVPEERVGLIVGDMQRLADSISVMVDDAERYRRVVPHHFMVSVKKLVRYLNRLMRF